MDSAHRSVIQYIVYVITLLYCFVKTGSALSCYTCQNYGSLLTKPVLDIPDCSSVTGSNNATYGVAICPAESHFCMKMQGIIYPSNSVAPPSDSAHVGMQRGCVSHNITNSFPVSGNSYRAEGACQTGERRFQVPDPDAYFNPITNSTPMLNYTFSGTYCLCHGDNCNTAANVRAVIPVFIISFATFLGLQYFVSVY